MRVISLGDIHKIGYKTLMPKLANIITSLRKSSFVKNILLVMSGTALAQALGFLLSPVISRLYSPSDFGIFGSFNSIAKIIAAGVTLQYTQAIMLPKMKEEAINLFFVSCLATSLISFLVLIVCLIIPATVNGVMKTSGIWAMALLVTITMVSGLNMSSQSWCVRVKAFKHTAASQVIRSLSANGARIGLGSLKAGSPGLIISAVLGDLLASLNLIRVLITDVFALRRFIKWERMKALAWEYRDFPMYSASQNVINASSAGLPVLLLAHFYGIATAGAYAFGIQILHAPMSFFLVALRQVLFQRAAETQHQGNSLIDLYIKTTAGLFAMVLLPSLVLILWAPQIFSWIFGSEWYFSGELARSLIIWLAVVFCNLPAVLFARIIRIQRFVFFYDLALLAVRLLVLVLGGMYLNVLKTVMVFALVGAAMNTFLIFQVGRSVMKKERSKHKTVFP